MSHHGKVIEPSSLSPVIDISPELAVEKDVASPEDGPGPLASVVLIEQIKRAGAIMKVRPYEVITFVLVLAV